MAKFEELVGQTIIKTVGFERHSDIVKFYTAEGNQYSMYHEQDCCECVCIEDIDGDVEDLCDTPILMAEEVVSDDDPPLDEYAESYTWTYYKLATIKGSVTIRWYGTSNGYYSERVYFYKIGEHDD